MRLISWAPLLVFGLKAFVLASPLASPSEGPTPVVVARQASTTNLALKRDWNIDSADVKQLGLKKTDHKMLWTLDKIPLGGKPDTAKDPYAWMTMQRSIYPMVQTVNSKYISKVECDRKAGWIKMQFSTQSSYDWAWNDWKTKRGQWGNYAVVTPEASCRNGDSVSTAGWLIAKSESKNDGTKTITCQIQDSTFAEVVGGDNPVDIEFENFNNGPVNAQANDHPGSGGFQDLGGEGLAEPSGDGQFDDLLDHTIGKMDFATFEAKNLARFDVTLEDFYGESDLPDLAEKNLLARRKIGDRIKKAVKKVKAAVKTAVTAVKTAVKQVAEAVVAVIDKVEEALADFTTIRKTISKDIDFDSTKLGNIVTTPFKNRKGYELFSGSVEKELANGVTLEGSIDVFCVECFVQADLQLRGKVTFIVSRLSFEEGFVELQGSASAGIGMGLIAEFTASKEFKKQITSIPLQPFAIPNVFVLGPKLDISVGVNLELEIEGSLLAGVRLDWPNISARLDVVDSKTSFASGFTPKVTPIVELDAEISITSTFFIEEALGFGLDIGNGLFDKSVELILKPGVFVTASIGGSFDLVNGGGISTGDDQCPGVLVVIGLSMEVAANVFDIDSLFSVLFSDSVDLKDFCFPIKTRRDANKLPGRSGYLALPSGPSLARRADIGETVFPGGRMSKLYSRDAAQSFRLRYSPNGNTYAVSESKIPKQDNNKEWSGWFAADSSGAFIYGDSHARFFHGYSDNLKSLGVSRLRLHEPENMPKTAWPLAWTSVVIKDQPEQYNSVPSDTPVMVISDLAGDIYFPVHCTYQSEKVYGKIFVVKDIKAGIQTLMSNSPNVLQHVTGYPVKECGYISITNGLRGLDIDEDLPSEGQVCSGLFEQCDGQNWKGPKCCQPGAMCTFKDAFYSQCLGGFECAPKFYQCGGLNYNGPTCCQTGLVCAVKNAGYSQCLPPGETPK